MTNRVFITKAVHLKAVGKKADTVIAGHLSPLDARDGCGTDSIRCIGIAAAAKGTTIEGFTFRDGRSTNTSSSDRAYRKGGGIYYHGTDKGVTVVDCDFIDCRAAYGARHAASWRYAALPIRAMARLVFSTGACSFRASW